MCKFLAVPNGSDDFLAPYSCKGRDASVDVDDVGEVDVAADDGFNLPLLCRCRALFLMSRRSEYDKNRAQSSTKQGIDNPAVDITAL